MKLFGERFDSDLYEPVILVIVFFLPFVHVGQEFFISEFCESLTRFWATFRHHSTLYFINRGIIFIGNLFFGFSFQFLKIGRMLAKQDRNKGIELHPVETTLTLSEKILREFFIRPLANPLAKISFRRTTTDGIEDLCPLFFRDQFHPEVFTRTPYHPLKFIMMFPPSIISMLQDQLPNPWLGLLVRI